MWPCVLVASLVLNSSVDVLVDVKTRGGDAPLLQDCELLGMRALLRISSNVVLWCRLTKPTPRMWGATVGEAVCVSAVLCDTSP